VRALPIGSDFRFQLCRPLKRRAFVRCVQKPLWVASRQAPGAIRLHRALGSFLDRGGEPSIFA